MPLYLHEGKLLVRDGKLATNENCCCGEGECQECFLPPLGTATQRRYAGLHIDVQGYSDGEAVIPTPPQQSRWEVLWSNLNGAYDLIPDPLSSDTQFVLLLGQPKVGNDDYCTGINPGILVERIYDSVGTLYTDVYVWKLSATLTCRSVLVNGQFQRQLSAQAQWHFQCCVIPPAVDSGCQEQMPCRTRILPVGFAPFTGNCIMPLPSPTECYDCPEPPYSTHAITHCPQITYTPVGPAPPQVAWVQTPFNSPANTVLFRWSTTGVVDRTTYRLDGGEPVEIFGTEWWFTDLAVGLHALALTVHNQYGSHTIGHVWFVTGTPDPPPTVTLTQTPPASTSSTSATFAWSTTGNFDSMVCQLDSNPVSNCTSPITYNNLSVGPHTFRVTVANPSGSDFKQYSWTITEPPPLAPTVTITQKPDAVTTSTNAQFAWTTTGQVSTTTCQLDGGAIGNCTSPNTYTNLGIGSHSFTVRVANAQGNDEETWEWTVQPAPPATVCDKIVQLCRVIGSQGFVDFEVTFQGVTNTGSCPAGGWNNTYLLPGPAAVAGSCPNVLVARSVAQAPCGVGEDAGLNVQIRSGDFDGMAGPVLFVSTNYRPPGAPTGGNSRFAIGGASAEALIDQLLATGVCQIPFQSQSNIPFNFASATCTLRIFPA